MKKDVLLRNETAKRLYEKFAELPIVDYHCHLSPREIYEDKEFGTITDIWLGGDHYKWRLMRAFGIQEDLITAKAETPEAKEQLDREKFRAYAKALEMAAGSPLYVWSHMELAQYFEIEDALTSENADEVFDRANRFIRDTGMSPRKLIVTSNVEIVATTDDPADSLEWHQKIREDVTFPVKVVPSFRPDKALSLWAPDYPDYIARLGESAGVRIHTLDDLKEVLSARLSFFAENGCGVSDVGIEFFPKKDADHDAEHTFKKALAGHKVSRSAFKNFLFDMYLFLAGEYKKHDITMQLHLNAKRNDSSWLLKNLGPDVGGDSISTSIPAEDLIAFFDAADQAGKLPKTLVYSNNPDCYEAYTTACTSFRGVHMGAAWWFNDHERGIIELMDRFAENSNIAAFRGMLTDSRSFLSYARHDYFRRIFASWVGAKLEDGTFLSEAAAEKLIRRVYYENARAMFR
ncbi:MAG: glucuronate isomerase [Firmicutes bacterium]|nr:glucuronate isomerase [Bacillota bacterium]